MNNQNNKSKSRFVTTLEDILDENPDTLAAERSEKKETDSSPAKRKSGLKQRIYVIFGVIVTLFALIGLCTTVRYSAKYFRNFASGQETRNDLNTLIYPLVIMDISEFDSVSELSSDQIISAALWSLVMSADDMEKYEATLDVISVPAVDVEAYAAKLFGTNLPALEHGTVGSGELTFYYNSDTKSYNVPTNPVTFTYIPDITSISKNSSEYTLTVDYIREIPEWMEQSKNFSREVSKTVEFKLQKSDDSYIISSMSILR